MANLIDKDYFIGEVNIPDTSKPEVLERLTFFITKYEEELLRNLLGNALYLAFKSGTDGKQDVDIEQKWKDLRDGVDYVDYSSFAKYWIGLRNTTKKQSIIANYVYYWWHRDKASQTTAMGEVQQKSESGDNASPAVKMCRAQNEMVDWAKDLLHFLDSKQSVYPEWLKVNRYEWYKFFKPVNVLGI
jgi:hypothetical protein